MRVLAMGPRVGPLTSQAGAKGQRVHEGWCRQADLGVSAEAQEHWDLQRERTVTSHHEVKGAACTGTGKSQSSVPPPNGKDHSMNTGTHKTLV